MSRYTRNTIILAGVQGAIGTELTGMTGASNAVLVSDLEILPYETSPIDRALLRPWFGASEQLSGEVIRRLKFTVELAGTGVVTGTGTPAPYDALLQGCALVGVGAATPTRYSYNPISTTLKALTIYAYDSGVLHKYVDTMGELEMMLGIGDKPKLQFSFTGRDLGPAADSVAANPAGTYTAFQTPLAVTSINTAAVNFGGALSAGAVTGSTAYPGTGIASLKLGNNVQFTPLLGGSAVDITDRKVGGSLELDLTAAQEVSFMADVRANAQRPMSILHGTVAGGRALVWMPAAQLFNPKKVDKNGRRMLGFDFVAMPASGNDELQLILL